MSGTNDLLPFCPTDTGSNLLTESEYLAAADRTSGNKPGVASSKLVNKALRQAAFIASNFAQYLVNKTGLNVVDDANDANLLAVITAGLATPPASTSIANTSIVASVAASALTLALKDQTGADCTAFSPSVIGFRSATANSGLFNDRSTVAALSLVVPSGATLGTANATASYLYAYAIDTGAGVVLGISGTLLDEGSLQTSTTISAGASSSSTLYSAVGQTNKPVRLLSRILTTQTTAGTWAAAMSEVTPVTFLKSTASAFRSVTGTDSCGISDSVLEFSGASFNETIGISAVGNAGKQFTFIHNGTSLTQVYTLLTTAGQTINGIASGSYALYTNGESLTIVSDGANWRIVNRVTQTGWISAGTLSLTSTSSYTFTISSATVVAGDTYSNNGQTFTVTTSGTVTSMPTSGTGAPAASGTLTRVSGTGPSTLTFSSVASSVPVKGTVQTDQVYYSRQGNRAQVRFRYAQTTAGTSGTGEYLFNLPSGMAIDLAASGLTAYVGSIGSVLFGVAPAAGIYSAVIPNLGLTISIPAGLSYSVRTEAFIYSANSFRVSVSYFNSGSNTINNSQIGNVGAALFGLSTANQTFTFTLDLPISGWQP